MKTNRSITVLLSILTSASLLFACKEEQMQQSVPFEGTYTTTHEILNPAPTLKQRIKGISQAKPLDISQFVALATVAVSPTPPFKVNGEGTFSADNGNMFTTTFTGTSIPNADGTSTVEMKHTITGGTGKFAKSKGTFVGNAVANLSKLTGEITYKGTVSY
jgi:hypothetical protein